MEVERSGNIIIMCTDIYMDDFLIDYTENFYVGSYCDKEETLIRLQDAFLFLNAGIYSLPSTIGNIFHINVNFLSNNIWEYIFDSPVSQESTIHILSRVINLLKENNANLNFFCPES